MHEKCMIWLITFLVVVLLDHTESNKIYVIIYLPYIYFTSCKIYYCQFVDDKTCLLQCCQCYACLLTPTRADSLVYCQLSPRTKTETLSCATPVIRQPLGITSSDHARTSATAHWCRIHQTTKITSLQAKSNARN